MGAEKENTHPDDDRKVRKGLALIRKASIPSRLANLSFVERSEPEQSKPDSATTIRRPSPARSNTDLRTRSVRTLVGTKAVRDRTSIRVVLTGTGKEPGDIGDNRGRSRGTE